MAVIRTEMVPEHVSRFTAYYLQDVIEDYFEDPAHKVAFEEWQKNRKGSNEKEKNLCCINDLVGVEHCSTCLAT